jgi:glucosamine 6-phosphate synthetase-like amidotransferase/phosphosugar isomerase protein
MCGLAGCLINPEADSEAREKIKEIFRANLLANEQRGREATGIVACQSDGSFSYEKGALPASDFVEQEKCVSFFNEKIDEKTVVLMGHTREPTKGTVYNNDNNHPIIVGETVGVHNGVVSNDDAIFVTLMQNDQAQTRIGSVDSEAIFALLDQVDTKQSLPEYCKGLQKATNQLLGSFTTLFYNRQFPATLFCLRYENPISIHYDQELQSLFFSSRYVFLRKTFGRAVISPGMPGRTGFVFEVEKMKVRGKIPTLTFDLCQK